jgi:hypothetical protein
MWRSYNRTSFAEITAIAAEKLLLVPYLAALGAQNAKCSNNQALALLGCRLALNFHASAKFLPELCASHMAVCQFVYPNSERIIVNYPSEPVLAEASALITRSLPLGFGFDKLLDFLIEEINNGAVEGGFRGELVAKIILLLARDLCVYSCQASSSAQVVSLIRKSLVSDFLDTLCGSENLKASLLPYVNDDFKTRFLGGLVYFTHFVYVVYTPTRDELRQFFARGAAVFCRRFQVGIDLIIPVLLPGNSMSYILVTVKNYSSKSNESKLAPFKSRADKVKIDAGVIDYPYLVLFMDVGPNLEPVIEMTSRRERELHPREAKGSEAAAADTLALTGISRKIYPFLDHYPNLESKLKLLAGTWLEPVDLIKLEAKKKDLMRMMSVTYCPFDPIKASQPQAGPSRKRDRED